MTILSNNKKTQQQSGAQQVTSVTTTTSTTSNSVLIPTPLVVVNNLDSSLVAQSNPTSVENEIKTDSKSTLPGLAENLINTGIVITTEIETPSVDLVKSSNKINTLKNSSSGGEDAKTVNIQINEIQNVSYNFWLTDYFREMFVCRE